jgi:hypothetical protein
MRKLILMTAVAARRAQTRAANREACMQTARQLLEA